MKLQVKYLFPTSSSGTHFYIHQFSEGLGMGNILAHGLRMQKKPQISANILWIFVEVHEFIMQVQNPTCTPSGKFQQRCREP